jgi:hypothetical protein
MKLIKAPNDKYTNQVKTIDDLIHNIKLKHEEYEYSR